MKRPDPAPPSDAARIDELEARVALQDQSLLELGDEIYRQQRQIAELERKLRELTDRVKALAEPAGAPATGGDERPPHY
jgi:SlyX protein